MSIVADQVVRLDGQLDRIPFSHLRGPHDVNAQATAEFVTPRVKSLLRIIKTFSATAGSQAVLPSSELQFLLEQSQLLSDRVDQASQPSQYESELEWLLVSKATVQTYGILLDTLLGQIIPLSDHIWYWDQVLASPANSSLYMVQTSPLRIWAWSWEIYDSAKSRLERFTTGDATLYDSQPLASAATSLSGQWRRFYAIVQESILERSLANVQKRIMSPLALSRTEARKKQAKLKKLREMISSGLGVLIEEGLVFGGSNSGSGGGSGSGSDDDRSDIIMSNNQEWKGVVERSVALMDMVLHDVLTLSLGIPEFEDKVFAGVEEDPELSIQVEEDEAHRPVIIAKRLQALLNTRLPDHVRAAKHMVARDGRPSRLVRYWLPGAALLLSSTTIWRIFVNRRQEILDWIQGLGATARDFWLNWVVEPVRKIIGTIRHDSNSEIAIMSRDSLRADRESLERMVVDFTLDKSGSGMASISDAQVADIRAKVREGDVTSVLRAYEKDLRSPFMGAVRGDLVRTLLIQVQKTKVDVEVAMSGIDSLLKSQELVFGFVGLTPGILVSVGVARYLLGVFGGRRGFAEKRKAGRCVRVLRNIDRIFSEATPNTNNLLSYKDHGLLIAEVHVLRRLARKLLPADIEKDFLEDLDDLLANLKGMPSQLRALDRIRWAYSKWLT
ncbi:ATP synthase regulation protein NCA2 [Poronia punctata]|nr:ATP synthase regulation protein NCA2 [Poronia punctata]